MAEFADKNDSDTMESITGQTIENLKHSDLFLEEIVADTGYSSGVSYDYLERQNITAYIPPISGYKSGKDGFTYNEEEDCYICSQGVKLPFKGIKKEKSRKTSSKEYRSTTSDCRNCPLKGECCKKSRYKQLSHSVDKPYYDRAFALLKTRKGKQKMRLRAKTVEPVWGTLLHFRRLQKVYTKGNVLANKQVLMTATAYNLKKLMCFNSVKYIVNVAKNVVAGLKIFGLNQISLFFDPILFVLNYKTIKVK